MTRLWILVLVLAVAVLGCSDSKDPNGATAESADACAADAEPGAMAPAARPQMQQMQAEPAEPRAGQAEFNTEAYDRIYENAFLSARQYPLSTFAIDVDTASYANTRRFLNRGKLPPKDAVRIEEFVNYFAYDYSPPTGDVPFSTHVDVADCPWNTEHRLARIAIKGREMAQDQRPAVNLVFLLDVSGSMRDPNKLPLLKSAMTMLVHNLSERDRVAITVYAQAAGLVLPSTSCENKETIIAALGRLQAGGSTAGSAGIQQAYAVAEKNFIPGQVNRVILCTDGDFNVGISNIGDLTRLIEEKARSGVFLTVLGFGMGNLKDSTMETLADKGNGNYGYIDTIHEARKMLVEQLSATLVTIAKDVKIQVDFNPAKVGAYRLIGYENRLMRAEDFRDDTKDAGEIGAGHTVTALYEVVPVGMEGNLPQLPSSKYQQPAEPNPNTVASDELLTVRLRYMQPDGDTARELDFPVIDTGTTLAEASPDFHFAAAVASFGMLLRDSRHKGQSTYATTLELATAGKGQDRGGYRAEFIKLVELARALPRRDVRGIALDAR